MGRWSQYDELEYHVPGVGKRIGYDADTGVTYYTGGYTPLSWQPSVVVSNRSREKALPETMFAEDDDPNDALALDIHPFTESQPCSGPNKKKSIIVQSTPPSQSPAHDDDDLDIPPSLLIVEKVDGSLRIVPSSSARAETEFSTTSTVGRKLLKKPPPARSKTLHLSRPPPPQLVLQFLTYPHVRQLEYHVPGVGNRIGYDADTGVTYYSGGYRSLPWQPSVVVSNRPPETMFAEDDDPNDALALDIHPFTESQPRSGPSTRKKKTKSIIIVQSTPPSQSSAHDDDDLDDLDIPPSLSTVETVNGSLSIVSSSARAETEFSTTSTAGPKLLKKPPPTRSKTLHLSGPPPPPYSKLDQISESSLGDAPRHSRGTLPRRGAPVLNGTSQLQSNNPSESRRVTIKRALTLPPLRLPGSTLGLGWSSDGTPSTRPSTLAACRYGNTNKDLPPLPEFDV